ncbi:MAG: hypothetical protein ABW003_23870, partial [Microvirga sp.]
MATSLGPDRLCTIHDLYDDALPSAQPDLIVGDVALLTADAIARLKRGTIRIKDVLVEAQISHELLELAVLLLELL